MVHVNKLKGKIVERGLNIEKLSFQIRMDRATFYRKLKKDGVEFTVKEITAISGVLGLSSEEMVSIFFNDNVACVQ